MKPYPCAKASLVLTFIAGLLLVLSGCSQNKRAGPGRDTLRPGDLPGDTSPGHPITPDQLTSKDRCPARLHDIEGAMLMFYALNKSLPAKLEDLRSVSDTTLDLTCPDTGQPYAYAPNGLRKPGGSKRMLVYDSAMNSDGTRWCILAADGRPGAPQDMQVVQIPEPLFLAYQ
jgi:hypothetical protein